MKKIRLYTVLTTIILLIMAGCQQIDHNATITDMTDISSMKKGGNGPNQPITADTIFVTAIQINSNSECTKWETVNSGGGGNWQQPGHSKPTKICVESNYLGEGAYVQIYDLKYASIASATVIGNWSGCFSSTASGVTDGNGVAYVAGSSTMPSGCTATFTVTDVILSGAVYDASKNSVTSASKVYP